MTTTSALIDALRQLRLLDPKQLEELAQQQFGAPPGPGPRPHPPATAA